MDCSYWTEKETYQDNGKSLVIANIAKDLDAPVLVFQPGREILKQNHEKFRAYGVEATVFSASLNQKDASGEVVLATIGSEIVSAFVTVPVCKVLF